MARVPIRKPDGTQSRYFWSETDGSKPTQKTVYKRRTDGITRMRGVHYDTVARRIEKE